MRQIAWLVLGLVLAATGGQGAIVLLINHRPGALRWLPGGFFAQLIVYVVLLLVGYQMAKRHRVNPDPRQQHGSGRGQQRP